MATTFSIEHAPELDSIANGLWNLGVTPADCFAVIGSVKESRESQTQVFAWKEELRQAGIDTPADAFERLLLACAVHDSAPKLEALPLHPSVKVLMRKEFQAYLRPPGSGSELLAGTDPFAAAAKIASLRRFVAGPFDWVISGMPRSWLGKMPLHKVPEVLLYIAGQFGGFKPAFYLHLAPPPRNRSLIIPKEVRKAHYRMVKSLALQPEMKGILCASWFHDPEVLRITPHLGPLNEPYLEHGGRILMNIGPAPAHAGFLLHNPERQKQYESGEFRPRLTLAMWPRKAAIAWADQHPELEN
jgi:hypothetical protein